MGETAELRSIEEITLPESGGEGELELLPVGMKLDVRTGLLGFGNQLESSLLLTSADLSDPNQITAKSDASVKLEASFPDQTTMVLSELGEDGTRVVLFLTPNLLGVTGELMGARGPKVD